MPLLLSHHAVSFEELMPAFGFTDLQKSPLGRFLSGVGVSEALLPGIITVRTSSSPSSSPHPICFSPSIPLFDITSIQIPGLLYLEIPIYPKFSFSPLIPSFFLIHGTTLLTHSLSPPCYAPAQSLPTPFQSTMPQVSLLNADHLSIFQCLPGLILPLPWSLGPSPSHLCCSIKPLFSALLVLWIPAIPNCLSVPGFCIYPTLLGPCSHCPLYLKCLSHFLSHFLVWLSTGHHLGFSLAIISSRMPSLPSKLAWVPPLSFSIALTSLWHGPVISPCMVCLLAYLPCSLPPGWAPMGPQRWIPPQTWGSFPQCPSLAQSLPKALTAAPTMCSHGHMMCRHKIFKYNPLIMPSFSSWLPLRVISLPVVDIGTAVGLFSEYFTKGLCRALTSRGILLPPTVPTPPAFCTKAHIQGLQDSMNMFHSTWGWKRNQVQKCMESELRLTTTVRLQL